MRKQFIHLLGALIILYSLPVLCQDDISYGSNNGNYVTVFDTQIYYEEYGTGTPLLLLHGNFGSMAYYKMVIPELSNYFNVIAVDFPGFGRSYHADSISFRLFSDYMSEMIDIMRLDSVYVLGCSMGSSVALLLAHNRPDKVKRIISDGGVVNLEGFTPQGVKFLHSISLENRSKSWIDWYNSINPQKDQLEKLMHYDSKLVEELPLLTKQELGNTKSKTLVMMGDRDFAITLEHGLELYNSIPNSEFCVLPNGGHCLCNKKPDLVNSIVIDFLTNE